MSPKLTYNECSGSVTGHGLTDVRGRCPWCERKIEGTLPRRDLRSWRTEMDVEYRRFYDPDFGDDPLDA